MRRIPAGSRQQAALAALSYPLFWLLEMTALVRAIAVPAGGIVWRGQVALFELDRQWLGMLAFGPFALTLIAGLLWLAKISTNFMIPVFFMCPIALAASMSQLGEQVCRPDRPGAGLPYLHLPDAAEQWREEHPRILEKPVAATCSCITTRPKAESAA